MYEEILICYFVLTSTLEPLLWNMFGNEKPLLWNEQHSLSFHDAHAHTEGFKVRCGWRVVLTYEIRERNLFHKRGKNIP